VKAITVLQPWASLLFPGPRLETSWWGTDHRGRIAIHAGLEPFNGNYNFGHQFIVCASEAFGVSKERVLSHVEALPIGAVIGEAELTDCRRIVSSRVVYIHERFPAGDAAEVVLEGDGGKPRLVTGLDAVLGKFNEGRYVMFIEGGELYPQPIRCPGKPRLWEWRRPE
jgi:hypothetical protein